MGKPLLFARMLLALLGCASIAMGPLPKALGQGATGKPYAGQAQSGRQATGTQTQGPRHILPPGFRTLNALEGRTIVQNMAWADDEEGLSPDCSHLVHVLYERAGYPYPYASSTDLYHGAQPGHFVRVRYARAGDLIVWPGHVGIVVSPLEHSFFSTTSSGAQTENYASPYWRARGHARFFRYITNHPAKSGGIVDASNRPPKRSLEKEGMLQADNRVSEDRPPLQTLKKASAPVEPDKARGATAAASAVRGDPSLALPRGGKTPKAEDVTAALAEANLNAAELLRASNLEHLEQPVIVYRELQVGTIEVKGKRGTAQVQFEALAQLSAEGIRSQQGWEEHKLGLQRAKKGWQMEQPPNNIYVPRDAALRVLSSRLAALTQSAASDEKEREQADIIHFLSLLVE